MDAQQAQAILESQSWTFAKTMPHCPHWYTLRKRWTSQQDFLEVVTFINSHGFVERWGNKPYTAWIAGGFKYWTMGYPVYLDPHQDPANNTCLINRKPTDEKAPVSLSPPPPYYRTTAGEAGQGTR